METKIPNKPDPDMKSMMDEVLGLNIPAPTKSPDNRYKRSKRNRNKSILEDLLKNNDDAK